MTLSPSTIGLQYSGSTRPGFNPDGSFDRMIWDGRADLHDQPQIVYDLFHTCLESFRSSARSRLIIRTNISCNMQFEEMQRILNPDESLEALEYPNGFSGARHFTIGVNRQHRSAPDSVVRRMQTSVMQKIESLSEGMRNRDDFTQHALGELQRIRGRGMTFDMRASVVDLLSLWEHSFGWSEQQCTSYAAGEHPDERIFLLRDEAGRAISGVLLSGGESTEWSTLPEHQGNGYIAPLLIFSNCAAIRDGMRKVFVEARWDRSISPSIKGGFSIPIQPYDQWLLTNHVTIGDDSAMDSPDDWNCQHQRLSDGTDGRMLRSFAVAYLDAGRFSDDVIDSYLSSQK